MADLTLAEHVARLIACLGEAVDFAQTTSPGAGHNAGMWQTAIAEAQAALLAEPDNLITLSEHNTEHLSMGGADYGPGDMTPAGLACSRFRAWAHPSAAGWAARHLLCPPA